MAERAKVHLLPYSGAQLWKLTEDLRLRVFKATLFLAALLVFPAVLMTLVIGGDLGVRLSLLAVVGTLCALGAAEAEWCYGCLRDKQWWVLLPALLAACVLFIGGARQNATFIVIGVAIVGAPAAIELPPAIVAGSIVVLGYTVSILARQQSFLIDGSAGDLAAVLSFLMAIYAAHRVVELVTMVVADVNRDAGEAMPLTEGDRFDSLAADSASSSISAGVVAQEATDQIPENVLRRLSEYDLTLAERPVAYLAGDGLPQRRIAQRLGKATKTVGNQLHSIKEKLGVETHAELTVEIQRLLALPASDDLPPRRDPQADD